MKKGSKVKVSHDYYDLVLMMTTFEDVKFDDNLWRFNLTLKHKAKKVYQVVKDAQYSLFKVLPSNQADELDF